MLTSQIIKYKRITIAALKGEYVQNQFKDLNLTLIQEVHDEVKKVA